MSSKVKSTPASARELCKAVIAGEFLLALAGNTINCCGLLLELELSVGSGDFRNKCNEATEL